MKSSELARRRAPSEHRVYIDMYSYGSCFQPSFIQPRGAKFILDDTHHLARMFITLEQTMQ